MLLGRPPYDKPNLRPIPADKIATSADGDATARFLDGASAMQYSFVAGADKGENLGDEMFFAKGVSIVIPDEMWPEEYKDHDFIMSSEDMKTHTAWLNRKDRVTADTSLDCVGVLQATEIFTPGSLVAVPIDEQKKLDGDFDGDAVILIGDRPELYKHVERCDAAEQAKELPSFKVSKSHTPAIDEDGKYLWGRIVEILATKKKVMEKYSNLQRDFLARSPERQSELAERAVFGVYEGLDPAFKRRLRDQFEQKTLDDTALKGLLASAEQELERAKQPVALEAARLLVQNLRRLRSEVAGLSLDDDDDNLFDDNPLDEKLAAQFPKLAEEYATTYSARDRIRAILDGDAEEDLDPALKDNLRSLLEQKRVTDTALRDQLAAAELVLQATEQPVGQPIIRLLIEEIRRWRATPLDERLAEMFPELAEEYTLADGARNRIQAIIDGYPNRMEQAPEEGYHHADLVQTMKNFLSIGIKVGTDAFKAPGAAASFGRKGDRIQALLGKGGAASVAYGKGTARQLRAGTFDAVTAKEGLRDNSTLAAGVAEASISAADKAGVIPKRSAPARDISAQPPAEAEISGIVDGILEQAKHEEPAITKMAREIAAKFGGDLPHLGQKLRSGGSVEGQLRIAVKQEGHLGETIQPITSAVRHLFTFPWETFVQDYKKTINAFEDRGYTKISVTNWFKRRGIGIETAHSI